MLEEYRRKRDFQSTPEPSGEDAQSGANQRQFVVQEHAASHLHYDFRLESGGVLKSWAVPKGPSMNPADKHLAVMVEDHPLSYGNFEGIIPAGEYGGGEVIVWDTGTYQLVAKGPLKDPDAEFEEALSHGKLHFTMHGTKLKGEFVLVKMHDKPKDWLLMKVQDSFASSVQILAEDQSVLSKRTIDDLKKGGSQPKGISIDLHPMLATEAEAPFDSPDWTFELKLDGVRVIAAKDGAAVRLISRNDIDVAGRFTELVAELKGIKAVTVVLDGELVVFDDEGKPSFSKLMDRYRAQGGGTTVDYRVFDLLFLDGVDYRSRPLSERRAKLQELGIGSGRMRVLDSFPETGNLLFEEIKSRGLEGIMAKRLSSRYESGKRSASWLKIKTHHSDEFVVGGFTSGRGNRASSFGALLLGTWEPDGTLRYVGNVGGGFDDAELVQIRADLDGLIQRENPFSSRPVPGAVKYVRPIRMAEVKYMTWTPDRHLRFPVFLRMRPDKPSGPPAKVQPSSDLLKAMDDPAEEQTVNVEGNSIHLTHLSKELWPATEDGLAVTKRDLVRYYALVADAMLPHLKDRPIAFVRHPGGIGEKGFFQKHPLPGTPDFVKRVKIWSEHGSEALDWVMCQNLSSLVWFAQMGTIEIHPWYSRISQEPDGQSLGVDFETADGLDASVLNYPDFVVFDLDPNIKGSAKSLGAARGFDEDAWKRTSNVALALRELLDSLKLKSFVKLSGKTGIHVFVPVKRLYDYDQTKAMAEQLGRHLEAQMPEDVTMVWSVKKRPNAVFFDHNQNVRGKTLASAYSPRVAPGAPVSFPVEWDEIQSVRPRRYTIRTVPELLREKGDIWGSIDKVRQEIA